MIIIVIILGFITGFLVCYLWTDKVREETHKEFIKVMKESVDKEEATPSERKTGRWIRHINNRLGKCGRVTYECSACNVCLGCEYFVRRSYCPNCGAKMEGAEEDA